MVESEPSIFKASVQKIQQIKNEWWIVSTAESQAFSDRCNMHNFYAEVKTAY